jgi:translation initiation factor 3 subunit C
MIWNEELSASLDQSSGVVILHRVELTRSQQLAQTLADRVNNVVEANEKALDVRLGGGAGWGDRADGGKGDKRGEQAQERRGGRGERRGASTRGKFLVEWLSTCFLNRPSGARGGRGARFAQGLGTQMARTR